MNKRELVHCLMASPFYFEWTLEERFRMLKEVFFESEVQPTTFF